MWPRTEEPPFGPAASADEGEADFPAAAAHLLKEQRVAIVGLGLIGGSLALALRGRCARLLAVERDPDARALAQARSVVDEVSEAPERILPQADVVVLATPVQAIVELLARLPEWHPGPAVVLDVGSTKTAIVAAMAALPPRFDPVGGHPMAGKETSGLAQAEAGLFRGAPFALTPLPRTTGRAKALAAALVESVGARALWLDPLTHDRWVAAVSHLPYLVSLALTLATPAEAAVLLGPGFRSTSRLAASSPRMMGDILSTNREAVLAALAGFEQRLAALRAALQAGDEPALEALLAQGPARRAALLRVAEEGE